MMTKKSKDISVTQHMLFEVRNELKHDISSVQLELKALDKKMDSKFGMVESKFDMIESKFTMMESKFDMVESKFGVFESKFDMIESKFAKADSKFDKILAEIHRIGVLVEEQNSRNKYVLDGYTLLSDRLDHQQREISEIKKL